MTEQELESYRSVQRDLTKSQDLNYKLKRLFEQMQEALVKLLKWAKKIVQTGVIGAIWKWYGFTYAAIALVVFLLIEIIESAHEKVVTLKIEG